MYRLEREDFVQARYMVLWSVLGFQAGFINAFGFLACGRYVSHVTGFGTQVGLALGEQKLLFAFELLGFPVFFVLGSFLSSLLTSVRIEQGKRPYYDAVTIFLPLAILILLVLGQQGLFGVFGEQLIFARDFVLLYSLSMICGAQNGCFATMTKGQIRTTHLTGISTDIGTDLARVWFGKLEGRELELTRRTNFNRILTFASFALGSVASIFMAPTLEYSALIAPLVTSTLVALGIRSVGVELDRRFEKSIAARSQELPVA